MTPTVRTRGTPTERNGRTAVAVASTSDRRHAPQRKTILGRRKRVAIGGALALATSTLLVVLAGGAVEAQQQAEPPSDEVFRETISVLEIEAWVRVERGRRPVTGLRAEDFEVRSRGRVLPIVAFEAFDLGRGPESEKPAAERAVASAPAASSAPGRRFLVVFDMARTSSHYLWDAVTAVDSMVENRLHPTDQVAIGLWGFGGANLLHGFTSDRAVIDAALDVVQAALSRSPRRQRAALDALGRALPPGRAATLVEGIGLGGALLAADPANLRRLFTGPAEPTTGAFGTEVLDEAAGRRFSDVTGTVLTGYESQEIERTIGSEIERNEALRDLARMVSGVPGPKYVLLMAQGYSQFSPLLLQVQSVFDLAAGVRAPPAYSNLLRSYRSLTDVMIAGGWATHAFDVSGVGGRGGGIYPGHDVTSTGSADFVPFLPGGLTGDGSDSLFYVSRRTGGDLYDNYNRLDPALERMLERTEVAYRLVFQLTGEDLDRRSVRYEIELVGAARGARLRGAKEYRVALAELSSGDDPRQLERRLLGDEEVHALGATVHAHRREGRAGAGLQQVAMVLEIPLSTRWSSNGWASQPRVWVQAVSLDADGARAAPGRERASLSTATVHDAWAQLVDLSAEEPPTRRVVLFGDLLASCRGGRIRVRILAGDEGAEDLSSHHVAPCESTGSFQVVAVSAPTDESLIGHEPGFDPFDPGGNPLALGGRTFLPARQPVVPVDDSLSVLVNVPEWSADSRLEALFVDDSGQPIRAWTLDPALLERPDGGAGARFLASVPVDGLAPRCHRLLLRWLEREAVRGDQEIAFEIPRPGDS